jgi:hypothetical protein
VGHPGGTVMLTTDGSQRKISTELLKRVRLVPCVRTTDYRDPKVPGFVLRVRPSGVHSWRVQLPDRRWVSLGRTDGYRWPTPVAPRKPFERRRHWGRWRPSGRTGRR